MDKLQEQDFSQNTEEHEKLEDGRESGSSVDLLNKEDKDKGMNFLEHLAQQVEETEKNQQLISEIKNDEVDQELDANIASTNISKKDKIAKRHEMIHNFSQSGDKFLDINFFDNLPKYNHIGKTSRLIL